MPKPLFTKLIVQAAIGLFCVLFGCIYGIHANDRMFLILSILIGICCIVRTISFYHLIHSRSYHVIEGTCTKREYSLFKNTQQILLTDCCNQEYRFNLDKSVKLLQGHHYRLYFRKTYHPEESMESYQNFLGFEELVSCNTSFSYYQ